MRKKKRVVIEKHHIFMDGSGEGSIKNSKHQVSVMVIIKNPRDLIRLDHFLAISKRLRKKFPYIFLSNEYKFNNFAMHLDDKKVKKLLIDILYRIGQLNSLEIYVKIIKTKDSENPYIKTKQERIKLLSNYTQNNFKALFTGQRNLYIFSDKNFFSRSDTVLSLFINAECLVHNGSIQTEKGIQKDFNIAHCDSKKSKGIQAADLISGAIFQAYERQNSKYYKIIEPKIELIEEWSYR